MLLKAKRVDEIPEEVSAEEDEDQAEEIDRAKGTEEMTFERSVLEASGG